jgi:undecaprenyl-diphosphatase
VVAVNRVSDVAGGVAEAVLTAQDAAAAATVPRRVALARGRGATLAAGTALAGFVSIFALVRANRSAAFDVAVMMRLQRRRHPWLARLMSAASWPGFPPQSRLIPPLLIAALWGLGFRLEARFQGLAWGTGLLSTLVKAVMKRPRPEHPAIQVVVAPLGGSSFPSGHTITYVGVYGFLAYCTHTLIRPAALRRPLVAGLCGLLALVGPSRIYQGHHWPTDVTASYCLGTSYLIGLIALYRRAKARARPGRR